jgi:hypothetical protein
MSTVRLPGLDVHGADPIAVAVAQPTLFQERACARTTWGNETSPNPPSGATFSDDLRATLPAGNSHEICDLSPDLLLG